MKGNVKYMNNIKIAIVGVGNCASSLIQGTHYYRQKVSQDAIGLMHCSNFSQLPSKWLSILDTS